MSCYLLLLGIDEKNVEAPSKLLLFSYPSLCAFICPGS